MGFLVGAAVGFLVGAAVGLGVGFLVGALVGDFEGEPVGEDGSWHVPAFTQASCQTVVSSGSYAACLHHKL